MFALLVLSCLTSGYGRWTAIEVQTGVGAPLDSLAAMLVAVSDMTHVHGLRSDTDSRRIRLDPALVLRGGEVRQWGALHGGHEKKLDTASVDKLLREARGSQKKMMNAYDSLKTQLDKDPENLSLKLGCAEALVSVMRIAGHANSLTCHFKGRQQKPEIRTSDSAEVRSLWGELAPVARGLLSEVEDSVGKDKFAKQGSMQSLKLEAVMYATASKGVVASMVAGNAVSFLKNVGKLEKLHPKWDGHQYCTYRGAYFLAAPWPAKNTKKGSSYFELAAKSAPSSRRNQYFAGVGRFALGDYEGARTAMEQALTAPCRSSSELDICDFLTAEAARTAEMLKDKGY